MTQYKIIVEKHPDGYVVSPLGLKGVVVGQGDAYEEALSDVESAIRFPSKSLGTPCWRGNRRHLRHLWADQNLDALHYLHSGRRFERRVPCCVRESVVLTSNYGEAILAVHTHPWGTM